MTYLRILYVARHGLFILQRAWKGGHTDGRASANLFQTSSILHVCLTAGFVIAILPSLGLQYDAYFS
ncbi:hypothetical protein [Alteromonas sp. ASW11-130]|uniref:hypothetical protein n=1 Tax=Alteromonas sp. ASW11-130 TaxID=3015775 RepID=UPI00224249A4|nr:hypothetical protein [Alteromonas sp. ASW11-130]MCW8090854.1 hypothetical protein [Alteromonas sp. ASW11-130]